MQNRLRALLGLLSVHGPAQTPPSFGSCSNWGSSSCSGREKQNWCLCCRGEHREDAKEQLHCRSIPEPGAQLCPGAAVLCAHWGSPLLHKDSRLSR